MATSNGCAICIALADKQVKKSSIIFTLRAAAKSAAFVFYKPPFFCCQALNLIAREPIVVITQLFVTLLNMGINSLLEQGGQIFILCLLIFLPILMPGLPLLVFHSLSRAPKPAQKVVQQLLRVTAGPDELLVRELSDKRNSPTAKTNQGRINTE